MGRNFEIAVLKLLAKSLRVRAVQDEAAAAVRCELGEAVIGCLLHVSVDGSLLGCLSAPGGGGGDAVLCGVPLRDIVLCAVMSSSGVGDGHMLVWRHRLSRDVLQEKRKTL